jgi:hypothetical protein
MILLIAMYSQFSSADLADLAPGAALGSFSRVLGQTSHPAATLLPETVHRWFMMLLIATFFFSGERRALALL